MPLRVVPFPSTFLLSHWLEYCMDKGYTVGIEEQNNKRNLRLAPLRSPVSAILAKLSFMTLLIPNSHKFLIPGVGVCENWFITGYFVSFNSLLLDLFMESLCPLLYSKSFGNKLYAWNVGTAPTAKQVFPVAAALTSLCCPAHGAEQSACSLHKLLSECYLRPEMAAPCTLLFHTEEDESGWTAAVQIGQVHQACHCPLVPRVSSSACVKTDRQTKAYTDRTSSAYGGRGERWW